MERKTNLEVLRIISMVMIIAHHYALHSGFDFLSNITINQVIVHILTLFGKVGVALFILISGYFYDKSNFTVKKFISLILKVWIYSALGIILGIIVNDNRINPISIIRSIVPVITRTLLVC